MMHYILSAVWIVAVFGIVSSSLYYLLCLWSAFQFLSEKKGTSLQPSQALPPVSILKPLKGADPEIYECFRSHCLQQYPEYEIIFGVSDANDPAIESVKSLQLEFPDRRIQLVVSPKILGANVKVSNLAQMLPEARYEHLIVNDSDIRVEPDYLRRVMAPLSDPRVGMVTCLYRGVAARTLGSRLEALGISTDFCAGVLAARQLENGIRFGLGSTLAFRRGELERIGGFASIVHHLADDYELGKRIAELRASCKTIGRCSRNLSSRLWAEGLLRASASLGARCSRCPGWRVLRFGFHFWDPMGIVGNSGRWNKVVVLGAVGLRTLSSFRSRSAGGRGSSTGPPGSEELLADSAARPDWSWGLDREPGWSHCDLARR